MGLSPNEVRKLSWWEFEACYDGWMAAHGGEDALEAPTPEEHDRLTAKYAYLQG